MTIRDELETWARAGNVRGEVRKLARDSLAVLDKLTEALEPFADAAKWFNATQSYLDDDCVAEREKHGLGTMRLNVGDLRRALAARETIHIPHDPVRRTRGGTPARKRGRVLGNAPTRKSLSKRLREAREATGISQSEVARRLHCTRSSVSQWEDGTNEPRAIRLRKLAHLYNVPHEWLALGRGGKTINIGVTQ